MEKETILGMNHLNPPVDQPGFRFSMCGTTYPSRSYSMSRVNAEICTIEYVIRGCGHVTVNGESFSPQAGDTYLLPIGCSCHYYSDRDDPWEKIWINLSGELAVQLPSLCGVDRVYHYPALGTADLLQKLQYYALHRDPIYAYEQASALVSQLFFRLSARAHAAPQEAQTPVQTMLRYIERHATEALTLEQIAASCERSPSQAERLFRSELGVSIYHYALERKLAIAKQLLTETGMSVKEIAAYLSFSDEFYFSGLFRRKVGISPSRYRAKSE